MRGASLGGTGTPSGETIVTVVTMQRGAQLTSRRFDVNGEKAKSMTLTAEIGGDRRGRCVDGGYEFRVRFSGVVENRVSGKR